MLLPIFGVFCGRRLDTILYGGSPLACLDSGFWIFHRRTDLAQTLAQATGTDRIQKHRDRNGGMSVGMGMGHGRRCCLDIHPSNPSIHQSINPSIHQSINPSIHQSINPSIHQSINPSIHQPINPSIH